MTEPHPTANLPGPVLLEIIRIQTEIVKLGHDLGMVMSFVAEQLGGLTGAAGAIVELAEGGDMVYRTATGIAAQQLGLRLPRQGSLSGLCVDQGQVLHCQDSETDGRVDREACRRVGLRSMVVAPLRHQDTVVGALKIVSPQPEFFTGEQTVILQLMSELVAASMFYCAKYEIDELYHRATHDMLTGLANRALFFDRLRQSLALARRQSHCVGILNLDMDGLKCINDMHGHRAGDAAIRELAARIHRASRQSDLVARLGGDEFGVILSVVQDRDSADAVAGRMLQEIRRPFRFEEAEVAIDASAGMALFPEDAQDMDDLMEAADRNMYEVKRTRKGRAACS